MQFKPKNKYNDNIMGLSFGGILLSLVRNNKIGQSSTLGVTN
jgi:hypothetical protein